MIDEADAALAYLYARYDQAQRAMKDATTPLEQRRDWAMRAEELRQCLRQLEHWRTGRVGSRYQPDTATGTEIHPPRKPRETDSTARPGG